MGWITLRGMGQLDRMNAWLDNGLRATVAEPKVMAPFIRSFGRRSSWNFDSEISPLGRSWQPLSEFTQMVREERGYQPDRPILKESGQLYAAAVTPFLRWQDHTRGSTRSFTAPYGNFEPLLMNATNQGGVFRAQISGSRVANQYGGRATGAARYGTRDRKRLPFIPARPFWGLTEAVIQEAMPSFGFVFLDMWRSKAVGLFVR